MSVRVVRWDTGREAEIPEEALRWGPDTKQGTCRAQLLRGRLSSPLFDLPAPSGFAPYVLPFEGAKWAVRVTLQKTPRFPSCMLCPTCYRPLALHGIACSSLQTVASDGRQKLRSLLEAAGEALREEEEEERPDALGEAMELLAEALPTLQRFKQYLAPRVRAFLEREISAEIRREWRGARG